MSTEAFTVYATIGGRRVAVTATQRTGNDMQLIKGAQALASVSPQQREQVMNPHRTLNVVTTSPIGSRFD